MYMHQKKIIKIENSLLAIFDEIPCTIARSFLRCGICPFYLISVVKT